MFPQYSARRSKIRIASARTKFAMVLTLTISTVIALAGLPALASTNTMSHQEAQALATMIAAPAAKSEMIRVANIIIMAAVFCLMAGMAMILGHSLKNDLEAASRTQV